MGTEATNILPNATGLDLGSPNQQWDGFFRNLNVSGDLIAGVPIATGNATSLQGVPVDATTPNAGDYLQLIGGIWTHTPFTFSGNATQLQGRNISANAPADTQALVWNAGLSQWIPTNQSGGGGGASFGYVAVGFSATPTFTPNPVGSCTFEMTLTGNVTSSTFTTAGLSAGSLMTFLLVQDSTGGRTFQFPSGFHGATTISSTANRTSAQSFMWNGSVFKAISLGVSYL